MTVLRPGDRVRCRMSKWGDRPHWEFDARWLGEDEHGRWIGLPTGTHYSRPGRAFDSDNDQVTLAPRDAWWLATFNAPGGRSWPVLDDRPVGVYVDMATSAVLDGATLSTTDLDLDVIAGLPDDPDAPWGPVLVDDEDEFAEHRVAFGYPPEVVRAAEASCADVRRQVLAGSAPFDRGTAHRWLGRLADLRR